jgi:uncharacterized protein
MNRADIIAAIEEFAKNSIKEFDSGHDWWHLNRVRNVALLIQKSENKGDRFIVELAALLHDIDDKKFRKAGEVIAEQIITDILNMHSVDHEVIDEVVRINKYISFSSGHKIEKESFEFKIVQDADRLDAIGAIGIARAFNYGGFKNNAIYIPDLEGHGLKPSTVAHFYDKLLLLKDMMNTTTARKMSTERHNFLERFLDEFYKEWNTGERV